MFTIENFIHGIINATRSLNAAILDNMLVVNKIRRDYETETDQEELFAQIPIEQIQPLENVLVNDYFCADVMLIKQDYIEVAVQSQDRNRPAPFMRFEQEAYEVNEHNYHFVTSKASQKYIFALFCSFYDSPDRFDVSPMRLYTREVITNAEDFFDSFRMYTVKITSPQSHSTTELKRIFDAYIFNIAYNFNVPFAVSDFTNERRFRRISTRRGGQLFPYKQYKQDLTKYYQQAIAKENIWMIVVTGMGSLITEAVKLPFTHKDIKSDYEGYCTLEQIIYHVMRCGLIHGTGEESKIVWNTNVPLAIDKDQNLNISPSFIWGLALCVITCPVNLHERVGDYCWISMATFKYLINDLWGKRDSVKNMIKSQYDVTIKEC